MGAGASDQLRGMPRGMHNGSRDTLSGELAQGGCRFPWHQPLAAACMRIQQQLSSAPSWCLCSTSWHSLAFKEELKTYACHHLSCANQLVAQYLTLYKETGTIEGTFWALTYRVYKLGCEQSRMIPEKQGLLG